MFKRLFYIFLLIGICFITYLKCYSYSIDKAVAHIENNALSKSHTCCAWFVMRAMQSGGCPIGIFPAWAYKYVLPVYGFKAVTESNVIPRKGDIVVFENTDKHYWGHIAMYNGSIWISDFKQKKMNPYKDSVPYQLFRCNSKK